MAKRLLSPNAMEKKPSRVSTNRERRSIASQKQGDQKKKRKTVRTTVGKSAARRLSAP